MKNEQLSPHFNRAEFACQGTDCCGGSAAIDSALPDILECIRHRVSAANQKDTPLTINSAFRCHAHNSAIGSSPGSQHPRGTAVDIAVPAGMTSDSFAELIESVLNQRKVPGGGIGLYDTFVHMDIRKQKARWDKRSH